MTIKNQRFHKVQHLLLAFVMGFLPIFILSGQALAANDAYFSLSPTSGNFTVGNTLVVTLSETSTSGDNMIAFQADLSYNSSLLQYSSTSLTGPFSLCPQNSGGSGVINLACAATTVENGTQSIATFTFNVLNTGTTPVAMTSGSDIDNTSGTSIWNSALPSESYNLVSGPSVSISSPTSAQEIYGNSFAVDSTSTANDGGSITSVALSVDGSQASSLSNSPYDFSLNTLNYSDGSHTLSVKSTDNLGDTNTSTVTIYVANGDLNLNGTVNISDLAILASNWGKSSGATYSEGDINGDGKINVSDLAIMAANWGWSG